MKKIIISHPTGNENTRHAVIGLLKANLLDSFHTCVACFKDTLIYKLSSYSAFKDLKRREFDLSLKNYTHTYPYKEILRIIKKKIGKVQKNDVDKVYHDMDYKVSKYLQKNKQKICAIYAYDEGAYYSFKEAQRDGIICLFDLPIIHWRTYQKLLDNELANNPQWSNILGTFNDSKEKLERKDQELLLADHIFVASDFTRQSIIEDFPYTIKAPIHVIPYGFPPIYSKRQYEPTKGRKLKFLYVGRLQQAKGLSYLFNAIKQFKEEITLTVVGQKNITSNTYLDKALQECTYIPYLPHEKVLTLMREHDVFIFPSLFEGFGLVITEAMSQGTPVITTNRTCGVNFIKHGENGWFVEAGSTISLIQVIKEVIAHKDKLEDIGKKAMETASLRPWHTYEKELAETIKTCLSQEISAMK